MALTDKNILIVPSIGASTGTNPTIYFTGGDATSSATINLSIYNSGTQGTLSFSGKNGQLFSITDSMAGTIFSVNDISGIPSIEVLDTGLIKLAQYNGAVAVSTSTAVSGYSFSVFGGTSLNGNNQISGITTVTNTTQATSITSGALQVAGGVGIAGNLWVGGTINATIQGTISTASTVLVGQQTASATHYLTFIDSNNLTPAAKSLYTTSSFAINPSTGNVNIGPSAVSDKLVVAATSNLTGLTVVYTSGTPRIKTVGNTLSSSDIVFTANGGTKTGSITYNNEARTINPNTMVFNTNNTDRLFIYDNGNIGIGISTTATSLLQVNGTALITGVTTVTNTTQATSTSTGALQVAGGVGVGGNLYVGGEIVANKLTIQLTTVTTTLIETDDIIKTTNVTQATATATGALQIAGGASIGGNLWTGGAIYAGLRTDITTTGTTHQVYYNPATRELTTATSGSTGANVVVSDTPPSSPTAGDLWFDSSSANLRIYYVDQDSGQWVDANSGVSSPASTFVDPIVADDISTQFNGDTSVFALTQDLTPINNIGDSKDVEVVINGQRLTPYIKEIRFPWFTPYDSFKGFRVVGNNLIIYKAPYMGDTSYIIVRSSSNTQQTKRYPFSASTIALGD